MAHAARGTPVSLRDARLTVADPREDIRGRTMVDKLGDEIGRVNDLLINSEERKVRWLLVISAGFLGGPTGFLAPVDAVAGITEGAIYLDRPPDRFDRPSAYNPQLIRTMEPGPQRLPQTIGGERSMQRIEKSIRIRAPVDQVYEMFRDVANVPRFADHVEEVRPLSSDGRLSHWKLRSGQTGAAFEFDAEIAEDEPRRSIGWRSLRGNLGTSGNVTFAELEDETLVHVILQWFDLPLKPIAEAEGYRLQEPDKMLGNALRRLKHLSEGIQAAA